jgi:hypothetical protein
MFETDGGEEELSFSCRVKGGAARAATETSKKQGAKCPTNQRRKEWVRRRRKAWEERRRVSATADAATATAAAVAATIEVATTAARGGGANPLSVVERAVVLAAPVNTEVKEASAAATVALVEEVSTSATAADSAAASATVAVLQRAKVAVWERRTSARAQILARRRESEGSEVLRSPDPVVSELEISWASGEREELECTKREIDEDVMEPERGTAAPHPRDRILCTICYAQYHTWCYTCSKSYSIERKSKYLNRKCI